jgi:hypothetical protein
LNKKHVDIKRGTSYFDEIMRRKLVISTYINGVLVVGAGQKMGALQRLVDLSMRSYAKPNTGMPGECGGGDGVPSIELRKEYFIKRLALLNHVKDDDEMRWLDRWTLWNVDIIQALDSGRLEYKATKSILNSALWDIVGEKEERSDHGQRRSFRHAPAVYDPVQGE